MDAAAFEQVYGAFQDFHAYFAARFGRRETRDHSRHYLLALLVQSDERRNAENLSETVPASARAMQRFLTESPWDDDTVIGRLQEYAGPRLEHPEAVCRRSPIGPVRSTNAVGYPAAHHGGAR